MPSITRRALLATAAAPFLNAGTRPRNLLFIASDDLNTTLSCFGHPLVKTPNIDRIAASGVRFERAYCQFPLCSPSRTSVMTGLAPDTTGVHDLRKHFRETVPDVVTLGQLFQRNGYYTARAGKIYHYGVPGQIGTAGLDDSPSWNDTVNPNGVDHATEEPLLTNYTPKRGLGSAVAFHASTARDEQHTDGMVAAAIVDMLAKHRRGPFFLGAGFYRPHVPWIAPAKYFDMFPLDNIELPPFDESEMRMAPELAYFTRPANWDLNEKQRKEALRAYYASIAFLDVQVGKVLNALHKLDLAKNTTIVFWSDHGYQVGEHGQWMKQTLFEASARIPMIVAGPGVKARGGRCFRTVEMLDIYPTAANLCGLKDVPAGLHGRTLTPLLDNPRAPWDHPAITQVARQKAMGYSIRTERYRYTMWDDGRLGEELYDYETDPREVRNRAGGTDLAGVQATLRKRLTEALAQRGRRDQFQPAPQSPAGGS